MIRHIPNTLTSLNLLSGAIGIVAVFEGWAAPAAYFVWIACVFDFFDGFTARALKVSSPIGKELDSLADVISFGMLPAVIMYSMMKPVVDDYYSFLAFSIVVFSAIRLAVFNVDETQRESFRGLPTPANALLITALPLQSGWMADILSNSWVLVIIILVSSWLLVSPIELFALKFKNYSWKDNKTRYLFLLITLLVLAFFQAQALPLVILIYIGLSLVQKMFN
jgi:CDP-diacylglycerol--serine O-phosphatidyltransferase